MRIYTFILCLLCVGLLCCRKKPDVGGKGGYAILDVQPQHHGVAKNIVNCTLYIKYNTLDAPANGVYDDSTVCTIADSMAKGAFTQLSNGNYYIYGYGYDSSIKQNIKGGTSYTISKQSEQTMLLPVSED